jgi:3-methyladenine DNA glycosylase AlkD
MPATAATTTTTTIRTSTAKAILDELKPLGSESYRKILLRHGVREPVYGVKIEALKKIQKRVRKDYQLALDLFDTGVYDAMYLAGLIADERRMTRKDLNRWIARASSPPVCDHTVPWVAAESAHGRQVALEWIDSKDEGVASAGWCTLSGIVALRPDDELDLKELKRLLARVAKTIYAAPDRVRYAMNGFVISLGCYVAPLTDEALTAAERIGAVDVDMGETACQVPDAAAYIEKVQKRGAIGKKRKTVRC